ncbi:hypothetical protein [Pseudogemmobacter bohemicus]|uniref:hypothetical protein n=1 Tax=Pseudogemmobacter bohemicus TaxID=2250708 RepID=UPI0013002A63|nr:hypothetical protein [Pseudogemmobacter bohemicus]
MPAARLLTEQAEFRPAFARPDAAGEAREIPSGFSGFIHCPDIRPTMQCKGAEVPDDPGGGEELVQPLLLSIAPCGFLFRSDGAFTSIMGFGEDPQCAVPKIRPILT